MSEPYDIVRTRRNLPHWKIGKTIYRITFRLADPIPRAKLDAWKKECEEWKALHPQPWDNTTWTEYNECFGERLDKWLDAGTGSCALANPEVREEVRKSLLHFNGVRFDLRAAVIMPTHVHFLMEPFYGFQLSKLLQVIKGVSSHEANKRLGKSGTFWQDESYDHIVRSEAQYRYYRQHIRKNPAFAGLKEVAFRLYECSTDIPVCETIHHTQTGMSVPHSSRMFKNKKFTAPCWVLPRSYWQ